MFLNPANTPKNNKSYRGKHHKTVIDITGIVKPLGDNIDPEEFYIKTVLTDKEGIEDQLDKEIREHLF